MPPLFAFTFWIRCVATVLCLALAQAAEPPHPLMGNSREQVLRRMGEPRSQIESASLTVLLYARERVVLRDGVVVDVELLASEPVRRPSPVEAPAEAAPNGAATKAAPGDAVPPPAKAERTPSARPAPTPPQAAPVEPKLEIKSIRPPSANDRSDSPAKREPQPPAPAPVPTAPLSRAVSEPPPAPVVTSPPPSTTAPAPAESPASDAAVKAIEAEKEAAEAALKEMKAKAIEATRRRLADASAQTRETAGVPTGYVIAILAGLVCVVGYLVWRWRQRQIELAATTVQNTPVATPAGSGAVVLPNTGTNFTGELLAQLDPVRFEILVAAYYNKTGVVATRAKPAPGSGAVMQIRISWKGEPKPFAGVLCLAHPPSAVDAKALAPMVAELTANEIRRGYVVTNGHFASSAKQFATDKQLTLLPGEVLLEKLNALPEGARREILQAVKAGETSEPAA